MRTRTDAAKLVGSGLVRLNGSRIDAASQAVRSGDVLTVALDRTVRVLRARGFAERRGGPDSVVALYEDLTPPPLPREDRAPVSGVREPGAGRPTKRDRRALDRLMEATGWKEP